jgi:hypothetical protein
MFMLSVMGAFVALRFHRAWFRSATTGTQFALVQQSAANLVDYLAATCFGRFVTVGIEGFILHFTRNQDAARFILEVEQASTRRTKLAPEEESYLFKGSLCAGPESLPDNLFHSPGASMAWLIAGCAKPNHVLITEEIGLQIPSFRGHLRKAGTFYLGEPAQPVKVLSLEAGGRIQKNVRDGYIQSRETDPPIEMFPPPGDSPWIWIYRLLILGSVFLAGTIVGYLFLK